MKAKKNKQVLLLFVLGYLVLTALSINKGNAAYEIKRYTINSGGGKTTAGRYEVNASIGQTDATATQNSGNYSLNGGFWHKNNDLIFKNNFGE